MEADAGEEQVAAERRPAAQPATELMAATALEADDAAADTTPPEPGQDVGWTDDEETDKWTVLLDRTKYRFVKRTPLRPPTLQHDIYITTSRQRTALLRRAHRLLIDERLPFIILHGLGAAIPVAVELALQLTGAMPANGGPARLTDELVRAANAADDLSDPTSAAVSSQLSASSLPAAVQSLSPFASSLFTVSIRTGTEVLIDDYVPLLPGLPPVAQQRHNSSIHITIAIKPDAAAAILASNDNRPTHTRTAAAATATTAAGGGSRASRGGGGGGDRGRGRGRGGGKHGHGNPQSFQPAKRQKQ